MAKEAIEKALKDSKVDYKEINQAVVGFCYGEFLRIFITLSYSLQAQILERMIGVL